MNKIFYKRILLPFYETYQTVLKGRNISKYSRYLEKSQWWPYEKLREFQWNELSRLLAHAYENVPYWRERFKKLGLKPSLIKDRKDFSCLPVINKQIIKNNHDSMVAVNYIGRTWKKSTGGSTGEPLHFDYTLESYDWRVAASKRGYSWAGCEDGVKQVYIWGTAIGNVPVFKKIKESLHHAILRQKYFNCFEFDERQMSRTVKELNNFKPEIIVGYTNPLYSFAGFIGKPENLNFRPKAVISAAENLHDFQRKEISRVFECGVFDTYGSREFMLIASECEKHNGLHINMENLLVEVLRDDGTAAMPGETGKIVITDLHNYGMPFIRYEIGDIGIESPNTACPCGRGLSLLQDVTGRSLDMIKTPEGRYIPGEFFPHLMKEFPEVIKFQVVQESIDRIIIKIVKSAPIPDGRMNFMIAQIRKVLGAQVGVDISFVNEIPLTPTGKARVTISNLT